MVQNRPDQLEPALSQNDMNVSQILASLDEEIATVRNAKDTVSALAKGTAPKPSATPSKAAGEAVKARRNQTPEGRARIVAAQKARWGKKNAAHHEQAAVAEEETIPA